MRQLIINFLNLFKKKKPSLKNEQFFDPRTIKLNLLKDKKDDRDFIFPTKLTQVEQLPDYIDLREYCTPIKNQGILGACHDDITEVLTNNGWKLFKDLSENDLLASVNPETQELIFEKPIKIINYRYDGLMYEGKHKSLDFKLTPNHIMLVRKWNQQKRTLNNNYEFVQIKDIGWYSGLINEINYNGIDNKDIYIIKGTDSMTRSEHRNDLSVPMSTWLKLLGIYIAEGTLVYKKNHVYKIQLAACKEREKNFIKEILNDLNVNYCELKDRITFQDKRIFKEFENYGYLKIKAPQKFIPEFVFKLNSENIKHLLYGHFMGDGCDQNGFISHYTSSKKLADDLQRLILLSGGWSTISERPPRQREYKGRIIKANYPSYTINEWNTKNLSIEKKECISVVEYHGNVYCAEVPTYHTLVTRRNNKMLISGNCSAFAAVSIIENIKNRMSKVNPTDKYAWDGSELYLYYNTRVDMTEEYKTDYINQDSGAYPRNVCKALQSNGISLELYCPYDIQNYNKEPSWVAYFVGGSTIIKEYYRCATINDIHNSLAKNLPVMTACQVYTNFMELRANEYNMIEGQYLGNHMMAIFGIDIKKRKILLRNSWSTIWGNCFTGDTKVKLLNGNSLSFEELIKLYENKSFWVYSVDKNNNIVPGLAHSPRKTKQNVKIIKLTLDNGREIKCTPNHLFMLKNGEYKEAEKLTIYDSLMPLNTQIDKDGYIMFSSPKSFKYIRTHWSVARHMRMFENKKGKLVVHHKNFNKLDNTPENLQVMTVDEHHTLHKELGQNVGRRVLQKLWLEKKDLMLQNSLKQINKYNEDLKNGKITRTKKQINSSKNNIKIAQNKNKELHDTGNYIYTETKKISDLNNLKKAMNKKRTDKQLMVSSKIGKYNSYKLKEKNPLSFKEWSKVYNHRVVSIEYLDNQDVYDLTVEEYHNFGLDAGVFVHNCGYTWVDFDVFNKMSYDNWTLVPHGVNL